MRKLFAAVGAAACLILIPSVPAQAQMTVIDPAAIAQAIKQVNQQLQMISHLQQQVAGQAAMLQKLGVDVTGPLRQITTEASALLRTAQGIGYQEQDIARQFQGLYPSDLKGKSFAELQRSLAGWQAGSRQTLQEAMAAQNLIVQSQPTTASAVNLAVAASQDAAGQTAAIQATNQLLASLSTQLTQLQTILITQARAMETAQAQALATKAAADAEHERVFHKPPPAPIGVNDTGHL